MRKKGNRCYKCKYFTQYYDSGNFNINPIGYGNCCKYNKTVKEDGNCKNFCKKERLPVTVEEIDIAFDDVNGIIKLIKEMHVI